MYSHRILLINKTMPYLFWGALNRNLKTTLPFNAFKHTQNGTHRTFMQKSSISWSCQSLNITEKESNEYVNLQVLLPVTREEAHQEHLLVRAKSGQTLLEVAKENNLNIDGTCEGDLNCSTCHCVFESQQTFEDSKKNSAMTKQEEDLLDSAWDVKNTSRLSCQVVVTSDMKGSTIHFPNMLAGRVHSNLKHDMKRKLPKRSRLENQVVIPPKKFQNITKSSIRSICEKYASDNQWLNENVVECVALANVLPFRTNNYVVDDLINWKNVPNDPMFQLNFPMPGMLSRSKDNRVSALLHEIMELHRNGIKGKSVRAAANKIRETLNPHPAKQQTMNVPVSFSEKGHKKNVEYEAGMQHKYRDTVLFFPSEAQYCHSYCTYCFRWPQFVGSESLQFASNELRNLLRYLKQNKNVTDVLFTGGDPMVMNSQQLERYLMAIVEDEGLAHVQTIRIGTKSLAYWPYKYVTDKDSDAVLRIFDSPEIWREMWEEEVRLGIVPYYMFIERDTGAMEHFGLPLEVCFDIYSKAIQNVSGLARTARGPSMSCEPGKIAIQGIETVQGEKVFVLKFLQARNPAWQERVFFAAYNPQAMWMSDLIPAFGEEKFFFEEEHDELENLALSGKGSSGQIFNE